MEVVASAPTYNMTTHVDAISATTGVPQEVTDIIVDLLSNDFASLKTTSLVSQRWRPRSQHHLHRALVLDRRSKLPRLEEIYADPFLAESVRSLTVETFYCSSWKSIYPLLRNFTAVRSLSIHTAGKVEPHAYDFIPTQFISLSALTLSFVTFEDFASVSRFLNSLPRLAELTVKNVYWTRIQIDESNPHVVDYGASVHSLQKMRFAYCSEQTALAKWLIGAGEKLSLKSLALIWYEKPENVQELLSFLGGSLEELTFNYVYSEAFSRDWRERPLDLSSNTRLHTLEFRPNVMLPYVWGKLPTVPEVLKTALSPRLTTVSVHLAHLDEDPVPTTCLSAIDGILESRSLTKLNLFVNGFFTPMVGNEKEERMEKLRLAIEGAMPKMVEKGVLKVSQRDA